MNLIDRINEHVAELTTLRHDLHAHPELGLEEVRTAGIVADTPGHTGFILRSGPDALFLWAEIVHVPGIQYAHPEAAVSFDVDPSAARESRKRAFDRASADKMLVAGVHHDVPLFGYLRAHQQVTTMSQHVFWSEQSGLNDGEWRIVTASKRFTLRQYRSEQSLT